MNSTKEGQHTYFKGRHALAIRIWHWITFSLFTATIVMVLLANTMFDTHDNINMVQDQVKEKGGQVTNDQAKNVAHEYNDKLWNTHKIIGYFLCFALLSRIVIEVALSKEDKIFNKIKQAKSLAIQQPETTGTTHYLLVKYSYLFFYLLFFIMAATGLILAYEDVEFLKPIHNSSRSIHEFCQYLMYGYIVVHLIGVIRADVTKYPGLISRMINSGKS